MIALIGSLLGFLASAFPDVIGLFKASADRKQELAIMDKQIEMQKAGFTQKLEEINANADIAESTALYKTYYSGVKWVDAYAGTVRPTITYLIFFLYCFVKFSQIKVMMDNPLPWATAASLFSSVAAVWGEEDTAIWCTVVSFWFGSRSLGKQKAR